MARNLNKLSDIGSSVDINTDPGGAISSETDNMTKETNGESGKYTHVRGQNVTHRGLAEPVVSKGASELEAEWIDSEVARYPLEGGFDGAERDWNALSRQAWHLSRITALFLLFAMIVGWPLGGYLAHRETFGTGAGWSLLGAYPAGIIMFALVVPALIVFSGYVLSRAMTTTQAAEAMANAARAYTAPDEVALQEIETVGTAVRSQMDGLNAGLDAALVRLADAEAMIRKHVDAIETAGEAIEMRATSAVERVATERTKLIDATENLNQQADGFANAIAERTEANISAMDRADDVSQQVEVRFDERLGGLEQATTTALDSFRQLLEALGGADENVRTTAEALKDATDRTVEATEKTRAATSDAKLAADEAVQQAVLDAAAAANHETVQKVISETNEKAGEEALAVAREEASRIARAAVESAGFDFEKVAREASDTAKNNADSLLEKTQEVTDAAAARKEELDATHKALEAENSRLEKLIGEQKARAERLATAISEQSEKLAQIAEATPDVEEVVYPLGHEETKSKRKTLDEDVSKNKALKGDSLAVGDPFREGIHHEPQIAATEAISGGKNLRLRFSENKPASLQSSQQPLENVGPNITKPVKPQSERSDFAPAVQNPREDLQRLNDLARDLAESRSGRMVPENSEAVSSQGVNTDKVEPVDLRGSSLRRENSSWKEILAAADDAEPLDLGTDEKFESIDEQEKSPLALSAEKRVSARGESEILSGGLIDLMPDTALAASASFSGLNVDLTERELRAFRVIHLLQQFTLNLDHRLYGECPSALLARFDNGDRNIFANRLLRLNEADVKKRIRAESARDRKFETDIRAFLKEFDSLLEEAALSPSVDEELREYLSSPLGRIYLLIGEIVGYFA